MEHTDGSMGATKLLITDRLDVNFHFLKNIEAERHKLIQISLTQFPDLLMAF